MAGLLKRTGRWWLIPVGVVALVLTVALLGLLLSGRGAPFLYQVF